MKEENFWMVWTGMHNGKPTYQHCSREAADREAKRLAQENPGSRFYVLKTMAGFHAAQKPVKPIKMTKREPDNIPF